MMDMHSRDQYLKQLRVEYLKTRAKKGKSRLLDESEKRTGLNRKYLIRKLRVLSNLDKKKGKVRRRKQVYDGEVRAALVRCWEIFDYPCGQRLKPLLGEEVKRLRGLRELLCSDEVADKLSRIGARTIDEKLRHQKEVEGLKRKYRQRKHPLLYQKIPVKLSHEHDRTQLGNVQIDLVEHCGQSVRGEYINTLSSTDVGSGWWEGEAVMGRSQEVVFNGLKRVRSRFPFSLKEIHSDNGTEFINWHLFRYTNKEKLGFSRSRPNKKNDNCFVEQKNWTHVKKFVGYLRYDRKEELGMLNELYRNELRLYKNFFQPVIKLTSKERMGGKIHRKYDNPRTPYRRIMESGEVEERTKQKLMKIYMSLNPAELKRAIDDKLNKLYMIYKHKNKAKEVNIGKKLKPNTVTFLIADKQSISVT